MGTIICSSCESTISHVEMEKVATLYSICSKCGQKKKVEKKVKSIA